MLLNLSLIVVFIMLLMASLQGITILYPLLAGLVLFILLSYRSGFSSAEIGGMIWCGIRKPARIYEIMVLVGASASLWMACGTVPLFIYYGLSLIRPELFVVSVFLITCLLALGIGSAFGTAGIIGVVFMVMARTGGVDPYLTAGAIVTAAYFCERSTPLSSCANLVAALTGTNLYDYLKRLFTGTLPVFLAAVGLYYYFSLQNPLQGDFSAVSASLESLFNLTPLAALPALVVLVCVLFKLDVRLILLLSMLAAAAVGLLRQGLSPLSLTSVMLTGYSRSAGGVLAESLNSSGIVGMIRPMLVIAAASAYSGIFEGTGMLSHFEKTVETLVRRFGRFTAVLATSTVSACFGCSQTFALITTYQFMDPYYEKTPAGRSRLAADIGNTAVIIPALIPWNVANAIPAAILGVDYGFTPYAFFLYMVPVYIGLTEFVQSRKK